MHRKQTYGAEANAMYLITSAYVLWWCNTPDSEHFVLHRQTSFSGMLRELGRVRLSACGVQLSAFLSQRCDNDRCILLMQSFKLFENEISLAVL